MNIIWIAPVHAALVVYLVYREIGWAAFIPIVIVFTQIPLQLVLAKIFALTRYVHDILSTMSADMYMYVHVVCTCSIDCLCSPCI